MIFPTTVFGGLPCKVEMCWNPREQQVGYRGCWEFVQAMTIKGKWADWIECKLTEADHEQLQIEAEEAWEYQQIDGD